MANTKSAIKHIKTSERQRIRNRAVKTAARTYVKRARQAITQNAEASSESLVEAVRALDRAAQKGVIHPNNAARRKSRLVKLLKAKSAT